MASQMAPLRGEPCLPCCAPPAASRLPPRRPGASGSCPGVHNSPLRIGFIAYWLLFAPEQPFLRWNFISHARTPHASASLLPPHTAVCTRAPNCMVLYSCTGVFSCSAHCTTTSARTRVDRACALFLRTSGNAGIAHAQREPAVSAASLRLALPHCPQTHTP